MSVATITTANTSTITAADWSPQEIESSMDAMVSPSSDDLFDGDILGDELMDIYNAAVVGGGDDDEDMNELPSLLGHTELVDGEKKDDDGFGAFRPSTSFNDLYKCATEDLSTEPAIVNGNVETSTTTSSSDVLPPVVSSTSLSPDLILATQIITPAPPAPSIVITTTNTNVAAPITSLAGANSGTKRKIAAVNATTTTGSPALKRRVSIGGRKHTGPSSGTKKVSKKKFGTNTPNPLASLTTTTTNVKIEPTKTILVPVKVEPVNQVIPHVGVSPQADVVLSSNSKATSSVPTATTITIPATSTTAKTITVASKLKMKSAATSSTTPAPILSNPPTEADFKSVAQAAVNTLIMNVGSNKNTTNNNNNAKTSDNKSKKESSSSSKSVCSSSSISSSSSTTPTIFKSSRVDTSTEHVKALTGSNWVAVCGGGSNSGNITGGDVGGDTNNNNNNSTNQNPNDKNCNRARRSNLTPDERARQNRDRNREHARNTRLRKKAYVEELKATLSALVTHRDAADLEKRHASQRELEQREVRFRVLEEFLKLRGRNEANPARWAAILEDTFHLTLPVTNFRDMVRSNGEDNNNNKSHEQVLMGVTEVMNDSNLCSTFLQSLHGKGITTDTIALSYNSDRNDFFMDNCVAMLDWSATTSGSTNELIVKGQIRAKFCPASNKLISAVMRFDTGAVISQVNCIAKIKELSEVDAAEAAAQYAANEADALLDSLQMPHFEAPTIPAKINYVPPSSVSSANSDDNSDDDKDDLMY